MATNTNKMREIPEEAGVSISASEMELIRRRNRAGRSRSMAAIELGSNKNRRASLFSDQGTRNWKPRDGRRHMSDTNLPPKTMGFSSPRMTMLKVEWEKEKQDLKAKIDDLEEYKGKYEEEKKEKERLEQRLAEMTACESNVSQKLMRSNEVTDKLRMDNKKKIEQIEKMQRDISYKDDRIRNLEIKASEVEKAELILETTRQNLESTVQQVRVRESEITRISQEYDEVTRKLDTANNSIKDLEEKITDLRYQVRQELMKNDNIEKNLEAIPALKAEMKEKEDEVKVTQKQMDERSFLLVSARKTIREYKEKIRELEQQASVTHALQDEVELSRCEINTLKKLMTGKDYLVYQKSRALDLSKEVIEVLNDSSDADQSERIQCLLDRMSNSQPLSCGSASTHSRQDNFSLHSDSEFRSVSAPPPKHSRNSPPGSHQPSHHHGRDISVNKPPYTVENGHHGNGTGESHKHVFLHRVMGDMPDGRQRPVSAMALPIRKPHSQRTSSFKEAERVYKANLPRNHFTRDHDRKVPSKKNSYKSEGKVHSKVQPSLEYGLGVEQNSTEKPRPCSVSQSPRETSFATWVTPRDTSTSDTDSIVSEFSDDDEPITADQEQLLTSLSAKEKDSILSELVSVGDRILISIPQKQPKYGKKKVLKPLNYTGIVKYKGKLEKSKYDARIFVGVRMDEPVGDTDGMFKGKRYMYTPGDQGKFFRLRDITSILEIRTGQYVLARVKMARYCSKHAIPLETKENGMT